MAKPIKPARYMRNERKRIIEEAGIVDSGHPAIVEAYKAAVEAAKEEQSNV